MKTIDYIVQHPIWSKVIASLITAFILTIIAWLNGWLSSNDNAKQSSNVYTIDTQPRSQSNPKIDKSGENKYVSAESLRTKYGTDIVSGSGQMLIIRAESSQGESAELARLLKQTSSPGAFSAPTLRAEEATAKAILAGNVRELSDSGLLGRVSSIRVLDVSASCRDGNSLASVVVCSAALDELIATSISKTISRNRRSAEAPGVSKQDALEQLSDQLRKSI
jgi:hypothetical protein